MMSGGMLTTLNTETISNLISRARHYVGYAGLGIHELSAKAIAGPVKLHGVETKIVLDFGEHTLRMGYGSLRAVQGPRGVRGAVVSWLYE